MLDSFEIFLIQNVLIMRYDVFQLNFVISLDVYCLYDIANEGHAERHRRDVMHSSELLCHTWMFTKCTTRSSQARKSANLSPKPHTTHASYTSSCIDLYRTKSLSHM